MKYLGELPDPGLTAGVATTWFAMMNVDIPTWRVLVHKEHLLYAGREDGYDLCEDLQQTLFVKISV